MENFKNPFIEMGADAFKALLDEYGVEYEEVDSGAGFIFEDTYAEHEYLYGSTGNTKITLQAKHRTELSADKYLYFNNHEHVLAA